MSRSMRRTSGRLIRQPQRYSAFSPEPLPPFPGIRFDEPMQGPLLKADRALACLDGSIQSLPNPDLFVFMYVRKEAVLSSQIEGTQASLADVLEVEARMFDPARPNGTDEILRRLRRCPDRPRHRCGAGSGLHQASRGFGLSQPPLQLRGRALNTGSAMESKADHVCDSNPIWELPEVSPSSVRAQQLFSGDILQLVR